MRKYVNIIIISFVLFSFASCEDYYLKKPIGTDVTADDVFSSRQKSLSAIAQAYHDALCMNISWSWDNRTYGWNEGTIANISGEVNSRKFDWEDSYAVARNGMTATGISPDKYSFNYRAIRRCHLVINSIDKVPDMTETEKMNLKGEMYALIAYRYNRMFIQYGGIPLVKKEMDFTDPKYPRSSLQETLDYIIELCDVEAAPRMANSFDDSSTGRAVKGVALAIKAQALLYAARPLFNSATPYLDNGEGNNVISFGDNNQNRWNSARDAAVAAINWMEANGFRVINNGDPLADYGSAVSTPGNRETVLSWMHYSGGANNPRTQGGGANGMSFYQLKQYLKADGTEQTWPKEGSDWSSYQDYRTRIEEMEPRYRASAAASGYDAWNNPNDADWNCSRLASASDWSGRDQTEACGRRVKFWYKAGSRTWFNFPIYRVAYFYLAAAEAENQATDRDPAKVLRYLNVIHQRAGLPAITTTDKTELIEIIQREWAVEFYEENHRLFDIKHWKHRDLDNGMIGGSHKTLEFLYKDGAKYGYSASVYEGYKVVPVYDGFWSPTQYLYPLPSSEVNKGYLIQNPGY